MKTQIPLLLTLNVCLILIGCESKMQAMTNQELREKNAECIRGNPTSPGRVTACENIRKECKAREKKGKYIC